MILISVLFLSLFSSRASWDLHNFVPSVFFCSFGNLIHKWKRSSNEGAVWFANFRINFVSFGSLVCLSKYRKRNEPTLWRFKWLWIATIHVLANMNFANDFLFFHFLILSIFRRIQLDEFIASNIIECFWFSRQLERLLRFNRKTIEIWWPDAKICIVLSFFFILLFAKWFRAFDSSVRLIISNDCSRRDWLTQQFVVIIVTIFETQRMKEETHKNIWEFATIEFQMKTNENREQDE